jgi:hypothetical protein
MLEPKTKTILVALLLPCAALAGDWRDGDAQFKPKPNRPSSLAVSWLAVLRS